jgi:hypothetical protein
MFGAQPDGAGRPPELASIGAPVARRRLRRDRVVWALAAAVFAGTGLTLVVVTGRGLWQFIALAVLPDVAILAGLGRGLAHGQLHPRSVPYYNALHRSPGPVALTMIAALAGPPWLIAALGWAFHISFDHAVGLGLRTADGFVRGQVQPQTPPLIPPRLGLGAAAGGADAGSSSTISTIGGHDSSPQRSGIDLYWLPLGAGGHSVRWNGRIYEALAALHERRSAQDLYHAALEVRHAGRRYVIEMGPVWNVDDPNRDVVCEGPVGARWLGRFRMFSYEIRCWRDGRIPDIAEAVDSPQRLSSDDAQAATVLEIIRQVPPFTWGRDELRGGDMWNSNSLIAWLLAMTGHDMSAIQPPAGGRAPGWNAGLTLASRRPSVRCGQPVA